MSDEATRQAVEAQADRNVRRDDYDWMVRERDDWQKRAGGFEREAQMITAILHRLTAERDAARAEVDQLMAERDAARAEVAIVIAERDAAERERAESRAEVVQLRAERDAARADLREISVERDSASEHRDYLQVANEGLREERDAARAEVLTLIGERNQSRIDAINWEQRTEALIRKADVLMAERDAAQNETHELRRQYAKLHAEADGLRADLLAHPPELHQELAIERKRHVELMEDYDRQNVMIGILEDAVKRAENALKVAQAKHVNPRIPGYAAAIAQLASQIEDLFS